MMRYSYFLLALIIIAMPARADCIDPPGQTSEQIYNFDMNVLQYCNGTEWRVVQGTTLDDITPAAGASAITDATTVNCTGTLLPLVVSCTATCPDGYWRSGCFAGAGTVTPTGQKSCFCALADPQCSAFCLK